MEVIGHIDALVESVEHADVHRHNLRICENEDLTSRDGNGYNFLLPHNVARFYPERYAEALENEKISQIFVEPMGKKGPVPLTFTVIPKIMEQNGKQIVDIEVEKGTHFYGGGEISQGLCLNNKSFITWNVDACDYNSVNYNLYQSHPYVLAVRRDGTAFGVIADLTYPLKFTMTDTNLRIENWGNFVDSWEWNQTDDEHISNPFSVTVFEGKTPKEVVQKLAKLTGYMQLPPKWTLGYHQCRWSYYPDTEAMRIANTFREKKIPCDVIWFDIHYMNEYKVFTFDPVTFPDPKKLNDDLHDKGFKTVWMIDPGVKHETGYSIHDQCVSKNLVLLKEEGSNEPYVGNVWPGPCVFPDFTLPEAREWWSTLYKDFMEIGIDGVWNDMNEPAIIGSPNKTIPSNVYHKGLGGGTHPKFHNIYGMMMVKATREGVLKSNPGKRPFVLSRSNFLGGQRYAATWTGDNESNWEHLKLSISMIANLGLSGQPFSGPDLGGFAKNADETLFARWMAFGVFLPFVRGHSHEDTHSHEPWSFGPEVEEIVRVSIVRRYKLLPYFYTLFHQASIDGTPVVCPTFFMDPTDQTLRQEDNSFLVGEDLLVIVNTNPTDEFIVNPTLQNHKEWCDFSLDTFQDSHLPILKIRKGAIIVTQTEQQYVNEIPLEKLKFHLHICLDKNNQARGKLYEDDGEGYLYKQGKYCVLDIVARKIGKVVNVTITQEGDFHMPLSKENLTMTVINEEEIHCDFQILNK